MSQAMMNPLPVGASVVPGTLRSEMEARRAAGNRFTVREALAVIVPLCTELAQRHAKGEALFVHPSSLGFSRGGNAVVLDERAHQPPSLPRDKVCLAPEERKGVPGDSRASVFAVGAILYELLTSASIGPGMRRPAELVPDLPPTLEAVLGKALVADPKHRPGDLAALAQALHHVAPTASIAPPPADESHLDGDGDFEVDIRLSMIPPNERPAENPVIPKAPAAPRIQVQGDGPYAVALAPAPAPVRRAGDPTQRLADMKAALESDPRPRYVVIKDGMDHGPFSAVELLQQIASGQFTQDQILRDTFSNDERFIKDWEEFAPFAEQAKLNREIVQEKKQFEAVVVAEKKNTQYKALIGAAVIGVFAAFAAGLWMRQRASKDHALEVQGEKAVNVEIDGGLAAGKGPTGVGGPMPGGGSGNRPVLAGGMSCEGARAKYIEDYDKSAPPDLSAGAYGAVLNKGTYLNSCGVPSNMTVNICAAVQNGRAVGVTVTTNPPNKGISSCVSGAVRGLAFPSHPRLDVTNTTFAGN
jgi:hypothetical protein